MSTPGVPMAPGSNGAPPYNPYELRYKFNASMAIIVVVLVTTFFFMALFVLYIRRCNMISAQGWLPGLPADQRQPQNQQQQRLHHGLDPGSLQKLPVLQYSSIKASKKGKAGSECAVCLLPYEESEKVRLLPDCGHLFHTECIDMWLETHSTCPLCRTSLDQNASSGHLQRALSAVINSFRRESNSNSLAEGRTDAEPTRTDIEAGAAPIDSDSTVELANASMRHNQGQAVRALSRQTESFKNAVHELDLAEVREKLQRTRSLRASNPPPPPRMNHSRSFAGLVALHDEEEHDELSELYGDHPKVGLRRSVSDGQSLKNLRLWTEGEASNSTRTMFTAGLRRSIKWLVGGNGNGISGSQGRKEQV